MATQKSKTDEAVEAHESAYLALQKQLKDIEAKAAAARDTEATSAIAKGNEAVATLTQLGLAYRFEKVTRKPRGPNKKRANAPVNGVAEQPDTATTV